MCSDYLTELALSFELRLALEDMVALPRDSFEHHLSGFVKVLLSGRAKLLVECVHFLWVEKVGYVVAILILHLQYRGLRRTRKTRVALRILRKRPRVLLVRRSSRVFGESFDDIVLLPLRPPSGREGNGHYLLTGARLAVRTSGFALELVVGIEFLDIFLYVSRERHG